MSESLCWGLIGCPIASAVPLGPRSVIHRHGCGRGTLWGAHLRRFYSRARELLLSYGIARVASRREPCLADIGCIWFAAVLECLGYGNHRRWQSPLGLKDGSPGRIANFHRPEDQLPFDAASSSRRRERVSHRSTCQLSLPDAGGHPRPLRSRRVSLNRRHLGVGQTDLHGLRGCRRRCPPYSCQRSD